jgi:hypothetical protein
MIVEINKKKYQINPNEFVSIPHKKWNFLDIRENIGYLEKIISLINELSISLSNISHCISVNTCYGGFIPINISKSFSKIFLVNTDKKQYDNIQYNIDLYNIYNIFDDNTFDLQIKDIHHIIYSENCENITEIIIDNLFSIIITSYSYNISCMYKHVYNIKNTELFLYIPDNIFELFYETFYYYINDNVLEYDNLINLCIMVKDAGLQFEDMLQQNLHIIDRWTILDTGSSDSTIEIINKLLIGKKKGNLYHEPFINFRDSRNRLLELAGKDCKFIIMLDDTYIIKGNLRNFLNEVRGDQNSDSFSMYIKSNDNEYVSNRIIKTNSNLKYKYKIHEVIQPEDNNNYIIPISESYIFDGRFEYMEERTKNRKIYDLKLLEEEIDENPNEPRYYYYMAQTYSGLENWEISYNFFIKRMNHHVEGYLQEKIDAIFEAARISNFRLNKPWQECEELYIKAYQLDNERPEALYFIGIHYYMEGNNMKKAFEYFSKAFKIGYPIHRQYSLKPTISFYFLPKFLVELCYRFENYVLGEECAKLFLDNNNQSSDIYPLILSWYNIFVKLNMMNNKFPNDIIKKIGDRKPLLCFVADGGFSSWTGSDILTKGVGGSETYIIEMARYIQKQGYFNVIVFCKCIEYSVFENVHYIPIDFFAPFIKENHVNTCIISRFSEYIPLAVKGKTLNVYLVLHDLAPSGLVIPLDIKLKKIFCLSEWHVNYFSNIFPQCKHLTTHFYYGIDIHKFNNNELELKIEQKIKNRFIYSSFSNRGLLELLKMWPSIIEKYSDASLDIYSDIDGNWVNNVEGEKMQEIRTLLENYKAEQNGLNIYYHGWVSKDILARGWVQAEYWFYPCTFMETFCLTALEAAISKTLAISNGLAALQNTVGERGIRIEGDATSKEWHNKALEKLFLIMEDNIERNKLVEKNYNWVKKISWENQANKLLDEYLFNNR